MSGKALHGTAYEQRLTSGPGIEVRWTWISDSSGRVTLDVAKLSGVPWRLVTQPTGEPTASYALALRDLKGADLLLGKGAARSATAVETAFIYESSAPEVRQILPDELLRLEITSAGDSKHGVASLVLLPVGLVP